MPFWSTNYSADPTLSEPKRNYRFKVEFQGINSPQGGAMLWYAKSADKPSYTMDGVAEHKFLNHTFKFPGTIKWSDVTVSLVDPGEPDMMATFSDIMQTSGYLPPANSNSLESMTKAKAAYALGAVYVSQLDGDGREIETWNLWNAFIKEVKPGKLDYGSTELTTLDITLTYDWATLNTKEGSVATNGTSGKTSFYSIT